MTKPCASVCRCAAHLSRALLLTFAVACGGKDSDTNPNSGDTGGVSAGGSSASGGRIGTGGSSTGGSGTGGASNDCSTFQSTGCGTCTQPVSDYCTSNPSACQLDEARVCQRIWFGATWEKGCGYVRVRYFGDVGDQAADAWEESTGALVYHWSNGKLSSGCLPAMTVGAEPTCAQWTDPCTGAGGSGGGAND